jgi:hypothetical protein
MPTDPEYLGEPAREPGTPTFRLWISDQKAGPTWVIRLVFLEVIIGDLCHRFVFETYRGGLRALDRLSDLSLPTAFLDEIRAAIANADIPEFDPVVVEIGDEEHLAELVLSADDPSVRAPKPQTAPEPLGNIMDERQLEMAVQNELLNVLKEREQEWRRLYEEHRREADEHRRACEEHRIAAARYRAGGAPEDPEMAEYKAQDEISKAAAEMEQSVVLTCQANRELREGMDYMSMQNDVLESILELCKRKNQTDQ